MKKKERGWQKLWKRGNSSRQCPKRKGKLFLQNGDPSENTCKARSPWDKIGAGKFSIPARSPDLTRSKIFFILSKTS